jgi:hypothetical protein
LPRRDLLFFVYFLLNLSLNHGSSTSAWRYESANLFSSAVGF